MRVGQVLRIDRVNAECEVMMSPGRGRVAARYPNGFPPPPLSRVVLDRVGPTWQVSSVLSDRKQLLHDDFTLVRSPTYGDTSWVRLNAGGTLATAIGAGAGSLRAITPATNGALQGIEKDDQMMLPPTEDDAYWLSWSYQAVSLTAVHHNMGFGDSASNNLIRWRWFDTTGGELETQNAGVSFSLTGIPSDVAGGQFIDFDLVVQDAAALLWVSGDGPFVTTTNLPASAYQPRFNVVADAASAKTMHVDWVHLELYTEPQRPDLFALLAAGELQT